MTNKKLTESFTFNNGLSLKNPLIMAPMTTQMSFYNGVVTTDERQYYRLRSGDLGAVITAAANVSENGQGWDGQLGVYSDHQLPGLSKLATAIKINDTKAFLQLYHSGRMTQAAVLKGQQPVAPSAVKALRTQAEMPRPLEEKEIFQIIKDFKSATLRAIKAGFDGVEIHGANTYLIQQFFSPHSNRRQDKWGGSLTKRFHFIDLLVDEITELVATHSPRPFVVGYRFSPEEIESPGIRFDDSLFLVDQLAQKPIDYLHVSLRKWDAFSAHNAYQEQTMIAYLQEQIANRTAFISVGDIRTAADAKQALVHSDLVALGRVLLTDPNWPSKVFANKEEMIHYEVAKEDRELLALSGGVWEMMKNSMANRQK